MAVAIAYEYVCNHPANGFQYVIAVVGAEAAHILMTVSVVAIVYLRSPIAPRIWAVSSI